MSQQLIEFVQTLFSNPPIPYNPTNQTLKGWMLYCLRDRGLKVDTVVNNADFEVQSKVGNCRFKIATAGQPLDPAIAWIVADADGKRATVFPAQAESATTTETASGQSSEK
jgi:hypothetical protein